MNYIYIDMDDVLVEFRQYWLNAYNKTYNDNLKNEDVDMWNLERIVKPECGMNIFEFIKTPGFFYKLPPIDGALESVEELIRLFGREKIYIISASLGFAFNDKFKWVEKYLPKLTGQIIFTKNKSIVQTKDSILLDDGPHNVEAFAKAGGYPILFDAPYNRNLKIAPRVYNWQEAVEVIKKFYGRLDKTYKICYNIRKGQDNEKTSYL